MIVANRKPLDEILGMIKECSNVLLTGCKGCVTVCNVGGKKEVEALASILKIARKKENNEIKIDEVTLERQCDPEYLDIIKNEVDGYDAVLSMACGVGPQFLSDAYPEQTFYPVVNTEFFGGAVSHGVWEERCAGCGTCVIHKFDGMCPVARCSKSLLHGPCGGSTKGACEISKDVICIWDQIVMKKMKQGRLEDLNFEHTPKNWSTARDGGPRRAIREELADE